MYGTLRSVPRRYARLLALGALATALLGMLLAESAHAAWFLPEQRLTWNSATQTAPDISGTRVAYSDYRNRRRVGGVWVYDTYVLDLKTMKARCLTPGHYAKADPAIDGNRVVWGEVARSRVHEAIVYRNLHTGAQQRVRTHDGGYNVDVSGRRVVYADRHWPLDERYGSDHEREIWLYDVASRAKRALALWRIDEWCDYPAISGSRVVWYEAADDPELCLYDAAAKVRRLLTTRQDVGHQSRPAISGRYVVWANRLYDVVADASVEIPHTGSDPAISGNLVVWADTRHGNSEIYLYDIYSKIEKRVTFGTSNKTQPTISGGRIVYVDNRAGRTTSTCT